MSLTKFIVGSGLFCSHPTVTIIGGGRALNFPRKAAALKVADVGQLLRYSFGSAEVSAGPLGASTSTNLGLVDARILRLLSI